MNELPKRAYLVEYSERITHQQNVKFMQRWLKDLRSSGTVEGQSLNLDFQSLPYPGGPPKYPTCGPIKLPHPRPNKIGH